MNNSNITSKTICIICSNNTNGYDAIVVLNLFIMISYTKYMSNKQKNIHLHYTAYIIYYLYYCNLVRCQVIYNTVKFIFR